MITNVVKLFYICFNHVYSTNRFQITLSLSKLKRFVPLCCPCLAYCSFYRWVTVIQGCGLAVSTSRSRDVPTSRLGLISRKMVNVSVSTVSVSGGKRLGLGHSRVVPKTNFRPNCAGHRTQCERVLEVVSLCCRLVVEMKWNESAVI